MSTAKVQEEFPDHLKLLGITDRYLVDLECIREMYATVMPVLQKQDHDRVQAASEILKRAEFAEAAPEVQSLGDNNKNNKAVEAGRADEKKKPVRIKIASKDGEMLFSYLRKLQRAESLFSKQSVVSLVSRFDEYLGKFLGIVLAQNPSWLKSSEKTLTYKELIELRSLETAVQGIISKEVEQLLRGSHEDQIDYIDDKLKLGIRDNYSQLPCFLEVAERRNLFVHTGGIVSRQYIEKCNAFGCKDHRTEEGSQLEVNEEYFTRAFSAFFELGLRLGQAAFRRLFPHDLVIADKALNKLAIKFLNYGDYSLAEIITNFDLNIPSKLRSEEPEFPYYARINRAIAQKRLGIDFEEGIKDVPWKAFHPKYTLCLYVLRDQFNEAAAMMSSSEILDSVGLEGLRTWPVFLDFRASEQFGKAYKDAFGDEYLPDPERDARAIAKQEEVIDDSDKGPPISRPVSSE